MKIGIFTESYKPYLSGVTVSVDTFASSLAELGHEIHLFAPGYPKFLDDQNNPYVFRFASMAVSLYKGFRVAWPFSFRFNKYIRKLDLDIIHSHTPYQLGWKSFFVARKKKIPFVYTFHTLFTEYLHFVPIVPRFISKPLVEFLVRAFCNNFCDQVITPTEKIKKILQEEYKVTVPVEAIPTGIVDEAVQQASAKGIREKYAVKNNELLLLYVGRFSKEKNIFFLLNVLSRIVKAQSAIKVKLMFVARGPLMAKVKKEVQKRKLQEQIVFTGEVERKDIYNYYKAADLFVCASKTETQGLVISEALACSLPVVAIDAAGVSEMVQCGEDGFLVKDNEELFCEKVLELIGNKELLRKLALGARKSAEERFLASSVAKKLLKVFEKAIVQKSEQSREKKSN